MNKKTLALSAFVLAALTACSGGSRAKTNRVAFIGMPGVNPYFQAMQEEFKKQFTAKGQDASRVNGSFNANEQVSQADLALDDDLDYIFIWPNNPGTMKNVVAKAHEKGTKVVSFVEEIPDSDAYIVTDPRELAAQSAEIASKWIDAKFADAAAGSVKVAVVYDSSKTNVVWQAESMRDTIKANAKVDSNIYYSPCAEGTDKGIEWAENTLGDRHIDVVLSPNCSTAMGISNIMLTEDRDLAKSAIFTVNVQDAADIAKVASSKQNQCLVRGAANAGNGADGTIRDFVKVWETMESGKYEKGFKQLSVNTYLYEDQSSEDVKDIVIR